MVAVLFSCAGQHVTYVTWATVQALWNYLRRGVPAAWDTAATR